MKARHILLIVLLVLLMFTSACGKSKGNGQTLDIVKTNDTITLTIDFGTDYSKAYVSVTVTDVKEQRVFLDQLQLVNSGKGETGMFIDYQGRFTVKAVAGSLTRTVEFELGDKI